MGFLRVPIGVWDVACLFVQVCYHLRVLAHGVLFLLLCKGLEVNPRSTSAFSVVPTCHSQSRANDVVLADVRAAALSCKCGLYDLEPLQGPYGVEDCTSALYGNTCNIVLDPLRMDSKTMHPPHRPVFLYPRKSVILETPKLVCCESITPKNLV